MAAPASPLTQLKSPAPLPGAKSRRRAAAEPDDTDRYRLHVVATSVADVVTSIGGLIFDRAMAGWDVTVAVPGDIEREADRALRILGARVTTAAGTESTGSAPRPHVLAVASDVFVTSDPVRRLTLAARKGNATEVLVWGRRRPPNLNGRFVPVRHRPSAAAQVFKSHALAARGSVAADQVEEGFYSMA